MYDKMGFIYYSYINLKKFDRHANKIIEGYYVDVATQLSSFHHSHIKKFSISYFFNSFSFLP